MSTQAGNAVLGFLAIVAGVVAIAFALFCGAGELPLRVWLAGAGALGLVTGFTTGLSENPGSGMEFVKFLGAGILVPLVGGVSALLARSQRVTENSTYADAQVVEKVTETVTSSDAMLHPLTVLGSFFVMFALVAILAIIGGLLLRKAGIVPPIKPG